MKITNQTIIYLATTVALCGVLYLLLRNTTVEGLSNAGMSKIIAKGFGNDIKQLEDTLLINKYSANYKTILDDMIMWSDLAILNGLISSKLNVQDGVSETNTQIITSLNQYAQLKETLQGVKQNLLSK
tara:strand:- start:2385 stop:2768 length:384 start_codon:yes stop_codon:yes gene_type:complete